MQLWSFARLELGLDTDEFYALTPRWFDALCRRHEQMTEDSEFMIAQLTSCVVNFSMGAPKEPVHPRDLMPSQIRRTVSDPAISQKHKRRKRIDIAEEARKTMEHFMQ
jgi:hypothetical protein